MENAVEALKFACAVIIFALALTITISSFSQANNAVTSIINMRDRETDYTYVEPSEDLTRIVGIETVVSSMYRAFQENIEIYFFDTDVEIPIVLYYNLDNDGNKIEVSSINLANEGFATQGEAKEHLDIILGGYTVLNSKSEDVQYKYEDRIEYTNGLYEKFKDAKFKELLGEYYQGEGASKIKKRVITYILQSP